MEIYKNDYIKEEDEVMWELHEIRHELHKELINKSIEDINKDAKEKFEKWKKSRINTSSAQHTTV